MADPVTAPNITHSTGTVKDLQTRFLYLFFFDGRQIDHVSQALLNDRFIRVEGKSQPIWLCEEPHHLYQDELLDHVVQFLFSRASGPDKTVAHAPVPSGAVSVPNRPVFPTSAPGCRYFRISDTAAQTWFDDTEIDLRPGRKLSVRLVPGIRIELFLSSHGVGVLGFGLTPGSGSLDECDATDFNYLLAQFQRRQALPIRKRHPQDRALTWERIPLQQREQIRSAPDEESPLEERLGVRGGSFTMRELIERLLRPLGAGAGQASPASRLRPVQNEFCVYTVARLGPEVDFESESERDKLSPFLAGLAQVEESGHAHAPTGVVGVNHAVLNRRHWVAVGQLGAAHLIADQPPGEGAAEVAFNEQRLRIVRDKYFIPYLMALLQRITLHRVIRDAGEVASRTRVKSAKALTELRAGLLEFAVRGHFTQVSVRQALHRFYQVAQAGLDVPKAWDEVRRAIADLDAQYTTRHQQHLARGQQRLGKQVGRNILHIRKVQTFVHMLEYLFLSVYLAHLWHMFAAENHALRAWSEHHLHVPGDWFVSCGVVLFALLGLGLASLLDLYLKRRHGREPTERAVAG